MEANRLTNVCRYNPYDGWDRGLFLIKGGEARAGRIYDAKWTTFGNMTEPGILEYRVEYFHSMPKEVGDLATFTLGISDTTYSVITQGICDSPIRIEGYAIKHTTKGGNETTEELERWAKSVGSSILNRETGGKVLSATTTLHFACTVTTPLAMTSVSIEYTTEAGVRSFTPDPGNINPLFLITDNINSTR